MEQITYAQEERGEKIEKIPSCPRKGKINFL